MACRGHGKWHASLSRVCNQRALITALPECVGLLTSLVTLDISSNFKLRKVPSACNALHCDLDKPFSPGHQRLLQTNTLPGGCQSHQAFPSSSRLSECMAMQKKICLNKDGKLNLEIGALSFLAQVWIETDLNIIVPSSIGKLLGLRLLHLDSRQDIQVPDPSAFDRLASLKDLSLRGLKGEPATWNWGKFGPGLKTLLLRIGDADDAWKLEHLTNLEEFHLENSKGLRELAVQEFKLLKKMTIKRCASLSRIPGACGSVADLGQDTHFYSPHTQPKDPLAAANTPGFTGNGLFSGTAVNGRESNAAKIMHKPSWSTDLVNALRRCIAEKSLDEGQRLHSLLAANGLLEDDLVVSLLVQVYASCGSLNHASALLLNNRCPFSWNTCITAYAHKGQLQQARRLFDAMPNRNTASWNSLLAGYGANGEIQQAKDAFEKLPQRSLVSWNAMVNVLARTGQLEQARSLFDAAPQRNVVSWNAMVSGYALKGQGHQARLLFQTMALEGEQPNAITLICLLDSSAIWCSEFEDEALSSDDVRVATSLIAAYAGRRQTKQAKHVFDSAANRDCAAWNALITAYADNGCVEEATAIFHKLPAWDMLTWAVTISAFARAAKPMEAMELYRTLLLEGLRPNTICLLNVLAALDGSTFLQAGMEVELVYTSEQTVATALVNMYGRCGSVGDAKRVFDSMSSRDAVAWNTMISGYAQNGHLQEARDLLSRMKNKDIVSWNTVIGASGTSEEAWSLYFALLLDGGVPTRITYLLLLSVCSCLERGRRVHDELLQSGIHLDAALVSALVAMYGRLGLAAEAWSLFRAAPQRDFLAWNAMCAAFSATGEGFSAVELFARMPQHCCAVSNTVMTAYVQIDRSTEALRLFSSMRWKDVASWTAMISAIASQGDGLSVRLAFTRMLQHGERPNRAAFISLLQSVDAKVSAASRLELVVRLLVESGLDRDAAVGSALVTMHGRCRRLDLAMAAYETLPQRSVVAWTSMITASAQCGDFVGSLDALRRMDLEGVVADEVAITSACIGRSSLQEARLLHAAAEEVGIVETSTVVTTAIISMYGDCGGVEDAWKVFERCKDRGVVLWTAMLSCYAVNGLSYEAVELFQTMECHGIRPDSVAFVSVLAACSHGGMLLQGTQYLSRMEEDYGVKVQEEHYACTVDLLARAGRLGDAEELLSQADSSTNSSVGWLSLLGASKIQGDAVKGLGAAAHVWKLRPRVPTPYLLVSNMWHD